MDLFKLKVAVAMLGLLLCGACTDQNRDVVAFLMPDQGSTRYDERDFPAFKAELAELCPGCTVIYQNANGDADLQQQQFSAALIQGARVVVLDPVDSSAAAALVTYGHSQDVKVIAYDRPIPDVRADYYISFDNEALGYLLSSSLVEHLKASGVPEGAGVLQINGSPTDAAAGLIRDGIHRGLRGSGYRTLAEFDTPDWKPTEAQQWTAGQITRFGNEIRGIAAANDGTGGGAIAALKAAGVDPLPPVSGNDAVIAALQRIIAGDQYNTISKPSEIVAAAAARAAVKLLNGETPEPNTTLYDTPSELYTPVVVTRDNLKAEIFDSGILKVEQVCTPEYAEPCKAIGLRD